MELFAKIVKGWKALTFFAKSSTLYVCLGLECTSGVLGNNSDTIYLRLLEDFEKCPKKTKMRTRLTVVSELHTTACGYEVYIRLH